MLHCHYGILVAPPRVTASASDTGHLDMNRLLLAGVLSLAATVLAPRPTRADVLFDNLSATPTDADSIALSGTLADSFSTGATPAVLTDVETLLSVGTPGGSVTASLLSDDGASPGSFIATLGTIQDRAIAADSPVDFAPATPVVLAPGTRYWIELSSVDGSGAVWSWSYDTSGIGVAGEFFANTSGTQPDIDGPYLMAVNAAPVPEPASFVLVALGGLAALLRGRRRVFRTAAGEDVGPWRAREGRDGPGS
jgi:hypothetical protein